MKHKLFWTSLLALAMLAACAGEPGDISGGQSGTSVSASGPGDSASGSSALKEGEISQPEDYFDLVFDTSQDQGKLTARYLYLQTIYGTGKEAVTTGDSAVYTSPDGMVMLVDCGNVPGGQEVTNQLLAMGVDKIDVLVLSHPHADHVGGFVTVADNFEIGQVYVNGHEYDSGTYRAMMEKIEELSLPCEVLEAGDAFSLGEEVQVQVFGPTPGDTEEVAGGYLDANDGSIAMRLTYGQSSFWTSGDLYITGEQALTETYGQDIASDVVKMNHHGKDTSNGKDFVQAMSPKLAVGMFDSVASRTVAMRYIAGGAEVFYNSTDGAIRVSTAGDGVYDVQIQKIRDVAVLPDAPSEGHIVIS